jgi:hypothetical protein
LIPGGEGVVGKKKRRGTGARDGDQDDGAHECDDDLSDETSAGEDAERAEQPAANHTADESE